MTGAKGIIVSTIMAIFKKNLKTFNDKNEAFEWLILES